MALPKKSVETSKTVSVPTKLLTSLIDAHESWSRVNDELEDYLLAHNPAFLKKMRKSKKDIAAGNTVSLSALRTKLGL